MSDDLEARLARFVEHHVLEGEQLPIDVLCADRPELAAPLRALVEQYLSLTTSLDGDGGPIAQHVSPASVAPLVVEGFQIIERIGSGGMGDVYKLRDLRLNRTVAAKMIRASEHAYLDTFLREARHLALFKDRRIVQIHEVRLDAQTPVIIMEHVEGFELGRIGPSLEFAQRARILVEICDAIHHAHTLGLQHRDLKPSNIMLDAALQPRILDFGLSSGDPASGHFIGTLPYVAPEQLDRSQPLDARTDVYSLGVILYELLCGRRPYDGDERSLIEQIRTGFPRLPVEISPSVPEPLQAIALSAMERDPALRYQSALDMAADLRRYLAGHAVLARPSVYSTTLEARMRPHLEHVREWLRLRLIHPHEAERLQAAYATLDVPEDDWILSSRSLSYTKIALYIGAFFLIYGSLFYFVAARWFGQVDGVLGPLIVLAVPFAGLNAAAHFLSRKDHKAVAIAFYLAAIGMLPLFLLILFHETNLFVAAEDDPRQLFGNAVSNRQLQVTSLMACAWSAWLALRTRTKALSTVFTALTFVLTTAIVADFGLRAVIEQNRWDLVAVRFFPLVALYAATGFAAERSGRAWFSLPLYLAAAALFVVIMELVALEGRALQHLGLSLAPWQSHKVSDPTLLDTTVALTINGALFYVIGSFLVHRGTVQTKGAAQFLFAIAPFALLHPLGYLVRSDEYSPRIDWLYAASALVVALLSERRQRRAFYYAGIINLGVALYYIAVHREWMDRPSWGVAVIAAGLVALAGGFALARSERLRR